MATTTGTPTTGLSETAAGMLNFLRDYANERLNSRLIDERRCLPPSLVLELGAAGLLGLQVERAYGGQELSWADTYRVVAQSAAIDPNLALLVSVQNAIGIPPIRRYADDRVKAEVLPLVARGMSLATIAATEPGAGSNVKDITTTATKLPTGGYVVNGSKSWISLGSWAGHVSLFTRLEDHHGRPRGLAGFLVKQGTKGFAAGPEALTFGMRGIPQNHITIADLHLPAEALLGAEGDGMSVAQSAFMTGRIFVGAAGLGTMKRCVQIAARYAERRRVATGWLLDNGKTRQVLSDAVAATRTVETLVDHIATRYDSGLEVPPELCLVCKVLSSELMWRVIDDCVQLLGARGFLDTNIVGQHFRDYRLLRIFEGATEAVTAHIGATILRDSSAFPRMLSEHFDGTTFAAEFDATRAILIKAADADGASPATIGAASASAHSPQRSHRLADAIGTLGCWAIAAALTRMSARQTRSETDEFTAAWCERRFRDQAHNVRRQLSTELLPFGSLLEQIGGYASTIGDTQQTLAGEARDLDSLLHRI